MKFKKGDKVRVVNNYHIRRGSEGEVVRIEGCAFERYGVEFDNYVNGHDLNGYVEYGYGFWLGHEELELVKRYKKESLRDMEVGDIVITHHGSEVRVLAVCGEIFANSTGSDHESFYGWMTFTDAEILGWRLKDQESEEEIVEVLGKKYKKSKLKERLEELERIKELEVIT